MRYLNIEALDSMTTVICLAMSGAFFSLYVLYDRSAAVRKIAELVHVITPGPANRQGILFWVFQPMVVLLFGLLLG